MDIENLYSPIRGVYISVNRAICHYNNNSDTYSESFNDISSREAVGFSRGNLKFVVKPLASQQSFQTYEMRNESNKCR